MSIAWQTGIEEASIAGGIIEGDVRINGHPKEQETFSRVSGYCEQFDVHVSPLNPRLSASS